MFKSSSTRKGYARPSSTFLIGGLIGAIGAYFFLADKGAKTRKKLSEKASDLSREIASRFKDKNSETDAAVISDAETAATPSEKAVNMINHLKQVNSDSSN